MQRPENSTRCFCENPECSAEVFAQNKPQKGSSPNSLGGLCSKSSPFEDKSSPSNRIDAGNPGNHSSSLTENNIPLYKEYGIFPVANDEPEEQSPPGHDTGDKQENQRLYKEHGLTPYASDDDGPKEKSPLLPSQNSKKDSVSISSPNNNFPILIVALIMFFAFIACFIIIILRAMGIIPTIDHHHY